MSFLQMLKKLINSPEAKHLILLGHFNKMPQSLLELVGSFSRSVNEGDSNPLVGI